MKKQHLNFGATIKSKLFIFLLVLIAQQVSAQDNNIKANCATKGKTIISYERVLTRSTSAQVNLAFNNTSYNEGLFSNNAKYTNNGFSLGGEYRVYISNKGKKLNGFYVAPNASIGQHRLDYKRTTGTGTLGSLVLLTVDVVADGKVDHTPRFKTPETMTGKADIMALGAGLKIGYQKRWKSFNLDFGVNFIANSVMGDSKSILLDNGETIKYKSDINGRSTALYLGLGFAF